MGIAILKYKDTGLEFDFADGCYSYNDIQIGELTKPTADIQFMDNKDMEDHTELTIEGRLSPILLMNGAEFGVLVGDRFYPAEYNERYAHTKAFGMSIFKLRVYDPGGTSIWTGNRTGLCNKSPDGCL